MKKAEIKNVKPLLQQHTVSGSINISKERRNQMHITSKSNFFQNELVVKLTDEALIFEVAGLDSKKSRRACKNGGQFHITINGECKEGKFDFDENESNEDVVVVYCR